MENKNTVEVVGIKKACEILDCKKSKFYEKYKSKLEEVETDNEKKIMYRLEDVNALKNVVKEVSNTVYKEVK